MSAFGAGLMLGWMIGSVVMYLYIKAAGLFRTRKEFYADRLARGFSVPEDWEDEEV